MKKNMKLKITAFVAMLFMALAVTFLSFSHADEEMNDESLLLADATPAVDVGSKTNVDFIIQNSNTEDANIDPHYNIIEITSDYKEIKDASGKVIGYEAPDTPTDLADYVSSNGLEDYVINGHSTVGEVMKTGMVNYKVYAAKQVTNDDEDILKEISNADLVYVNQGSTAFSKTNDICEKLYDILHTYAVGEYKPLIINSQKSSNGNGGGGGNTTKVTISTLSDEVFSSGLYYYTFAWDYKNQAALDFLKHRGDSMYLGINGRNQKTKGKWTVLQKTHKEKTKDESGQEIEVEVVDEKTMSKFIVLSATGTSSMTMASALMPDTSYNDISAALAEYHLPNIEDAYSAPTGAKVYELKPTGQIANGIYNGKYLTPDLVQFEQGTLAMVEAGTIDLGKYDFVIIDESIKGDTEISEDLYNKLAGAMYGSVSIVYPSDLATTTGGTTSTTVSDFQEYNYLELYYMVATTENVTRYTNVMITSIKELNTIMSGGETGAGAIADLINRSTYRGIGGKGSSSNMFTVLEIQPCYPIDEDLAARNLAAGKAGYYNIPANVLNDVDRNKLPTDDNGNITVEYYDWELTKEKVAEAVGIDPSKVTIVHKSTEELAASKEPILGTYDLVYIGGNASALKKDISDWRSVINTFGGSESSTALLTNLESYKYLPVYVMYSHNGDIVRSEVVNIKSSGGNAKDGSVPTSAVSISGVGTNLSAFSLLNGNDISYDRYEELNKYISAGMPVIVESTVANAYENMLANNNNDALKNEVISKVGSLDNVNLESLQNQIDPDCNVRKFLDDCYAVANDTTKENVLWNYSNKSTDVEFTDYTKVRGLVNSSKKRPKLSVTSMPVAYNYYDSSTRLDSRDFSFAFEVEGSSDYSVNFYIDDDGNSVFDKSENMNVEVADNAKSFKYTIDKKYFGPVHWKLEIVDKDSGLTAYTTAVSYIKNSSGEPQTVKVLQIMPGYATKDWSGAIKASVGEGAGGQTTECNSLYFCPICQNACQRLENNPVANNPNEYNMRYCGNYAEESYMYLGKHEHVFGIPMYDSERTIVGNNKTYTGCDDWNTNLADSLSDLYTFDLDIWLRSEFEENAREVAALYDFSSLSDDEKKAIINAYTISADNPNYADWQAIAEDNLDGKLTFITKREQEKNADEQDKLYKAAKAKTDVAEQALIDALLAAKDTDYGEEFAGLVKTKRYSDIYSCIGKGTLFRYAYVEGTPSLKAVKTAYADYMKLKDEEITYHEAYKKYKRLSNPDWLSNSYDIIIIGPSDDFGGDDITDPIALADLKSYIQNQGSVLLFHDTLAKAKSSGSVTLTATLREYFGMDRNRKLSLDTSKATTGMYYLPYKASTNEEAKKYFMTNLSYKTGDDRYATWKDDMAKVGVDTSKMSRYLTDVVYTDSILISQDGFNKKDVGLSYPNSSPYKYGDLDWMYAAFSYYGANYNAKENPYYGTDRASQNNKGIVTQYPFTLSDELSISGTHPQAYALEVEDPNMTVWYSLAGGTNGRITEGGKNCLSQSSMFAASRNDGMDSYFIYSYGKINYCGAGHSKVTGIGKDNNDERRLYINIIVNSVKKSIREPGITVYDYMTKNEKPRDGADYLIEVKDTDAWPEFSFSSTVDTTVPGNGLSKVRIYYDLDYLTATGDKDAFVPDVFHIMIAELTKDKDGNALTSGKIYDVGKELGKLQLKPEYFEPYNGDYTYIVIEVTDLKGKVSYQRIKIKLLPKLFEMT